MKTKLAELMEKLNLVQEMNGDYLVRFAMLYHDVGKV